MGNSANDTNERSGLNPWPLISSALRHRDDELLDEALDTSILFEKFCLIRATMLFQDGPCL